MVHRVTRSCVGKEGTQSEKCNQRSGLRSRSRSNICCGGRLSMGRYGLAAWPRWGSGDGDGATEGVMYVRTRGTINVYCNDTYVDQRSASHPRVQEALRH